MKIDFVSDVACPWCAVGLLSLERAVQNLQGQIDVELEFQPFELNPTMAPEGEETEAYLARKYGSSREQREGVRQALRERGAELGFEFGPRTRVWNTFDAHRLLCWAATQGRQRELKHALLRAYHGQGRNPGDPAVLTALAAEVGLDATQAGVVLASDAFAAEVREREQHWQGLGIHSVPSVVIDGRHLIQGGQPVAVFEQSLRELAAAAADTAQTLG